MDIMIEAKFGSIAECSLIHVDIPDVKDEEFETFRLKLIRIELDARKEPLIIFRDIRCDHMNFVCYKGEEDKTKRAIERILRENGIEMVKGG